MDLATAKTVALRTHVAAIALGRRASGYHWESGPGVGKTESAFQYAAALAAELNEPVGLRVFMLATIASVDIMGFMLPIPQKGADGRTTGVDSLFSTPPWYPTIGNIIVIEPNGTVHMEGTWTGDVPRVGVLFLDEFSQAEDDVKKPAAELVLNGKVGTRSLPLNWRVLSAGNRMSDRSGVVRELMFIVNRRCRQQIEASAPGFLAHHAAARPEDRPHYMTLSFAQKNPDVVFKDAIPEGSDPYCTPRSLCLLDRDLMALRTPQDIAKNRLPTDPVAREVAAGWIGSGSAAQFFVHLKYHDELPDMSDIERDPMKAKVPDAKDAQMVCGYMLSHNITAKNAAKVMAYIERLKVEMQILAVRGVLAQQARAADIISTPQMTNWLAKHRDVLVASRA